MPADGDPWGDSAVHAGQVVQEPRQLVRAQSRLQQHNKSVRGSMLEQ